MALADFILLLSIVGCAACSYYYYKEKKLHYEFVRTSRRHSDNKAREIPMKRKTSIYLVASIVFICISLPLLIQKLVELY